jgi:hypothetical protein
MARSLASALVFLALSTGAALAAPVPQQQERSFVIQFAPVPYTSQPQAAGAGAGQVVEAPNGTVVATAVGFRFRGLTPRGGYTVVSLGDVTGDGVPDAFPVCNFVADNAGSGSCTTQLGPGRQLSSQIELRAGAANGNAILRTF